MSYVSNALKTSEVSKATQNLPCQICAEGRHKLFYERGEIRLFECQGCGLICLDPLPRPQEVAVIYHDQYDSSTTGYFAKVEKKMRRSRQRVAQLKRYVLGGRFLDIGCNGGFMVEAAREAGFETFGVELDPVSIEYARKHYPNSTYFLGRIEDFAKEKVGFDAVYCSEVIEHIPDLNSFVSAVARVMKPGAILYITTPDISHWRRPRNLESWDGFDPPAHCIYFSPANFKRLLAKHGLHVFRRQFAWKPGIKFFARKRR